MDRRAVIVTTTNKPALERCVGPTDAVEIFTKPYDVKFSSTRSRTSIAG